jgi:uncharacterized protein GlcG (DUF336 family)
LDIPLLAMRGYFWAEFDISFCGHRRKVERHMNPRIILRAATIGLAATLLAGILAAAAHANLLTQKSMPASVALAMAEAAFESCTKQGYHVSVNVVGRNGEVLVAIRGDGAAPHTMENSLRKAYTAFTFGAPSGDFAKRVKDNPTLGLARLAGVIAGQGGLPIKVGDEVIGGVGVSGVPNGADREEACAKAGIDRVADELK